MVRIFHVNIEHSFVCSHRPVEELAPKKIDLQVKAFSKTTHNRESLPMDIYTHTTLVAICLYILVSLRSVKKFLSLWILRMNNSQLCKRAFTIIASSHTFRQWFH